MSRDFLNLRSNPILLGRNPMPINVLRELVDRAQGCCMFHLTSELKDRYERYGEKPGSFLEHLPSEQRALLAKLTSNEAQNVRIPEWG